MKNSNIIISVIIVLCIAGGVAAYNIVNPESSIFSLPGFNPSDDASTSNPTSDKGTGVDGTGDNGNGAKGFNGGSSSNGGSNNQGSGNGVSHGGITASQAKKIAQNAIKEPEAYPGTPYWDDSIKMWIVKVYDKNGNLIDGIGVESNGRTNRV